MSTTYSTSEYSGGWNDNTTQYNLPATMFLNTNVFKQVANYLFTSSTYLDKVAEITSEDQVILAFYSYDLSYSVVISEDDPYTDENEYAAEIITFNWRMLYDLVKEKTDNIVIVIFNNPTQDVYFSDTDSPIIYTNYCYTTSFSDLISVLAGKEK